MGLLRDCMGRAPQPRSQERLRRVSPPRRSASTWFALAGDPPGQATLRGCGPEQRIDEPEDSERLEPADQEELWDVIPIIVSCSRTNVL
jgi:hypothetical protein